MMEFIPEKIEGVIVINIMQKPDGQDGLTGVDFVVGVHNWLINTHLRYLVFDLQDEKEVNKEFIEELMQLMKRMKLPFLFAGVMQKPRAVLESYAYTARYPVFAAVEDAIDYLRKKFPSAITSNMEGVALGIPIEMVRSRLNAKPGEEGEEGSPELDD
jgi:hypothetical protein